MRKILTILLICFAFTSTAVSYADTKPPTTVANVYSTAFYNIPVAVRMNVRVLDEAQRIVDKLQITLDPTAANSCGMTYTGSTDQNSGITTYSTIGNINNLKYNCFFPLKLQVVDPYDSTFPSGIVTLPVPNQSVFTSVMLKANSDASSSAMSWSTDSVQQQEFPNGHSTYRVGLDINIDIRADYTNQRLTAYVNDPDISVGTYFQNLLP